MTVLKIVCAWCGADMGEKDGEGVEGISHGMCEECEVKFERGDFEPCPFRTKPVIKHLGRFITPELISCPTCGRTRLRDEQTGDTAPFISWVEQVDEAISRIRRPLKVAVMGCEGNGPGEARDADVGIALGKGRAALFKHGEVVRSMPLNEAIPVLLEEIERTW